MLSRRSFITAAVSSSSLIPNHELLLADDSTRNCNSVADLLSGSPTGPWRRLLLDAAVVEKQQGLARIYHQARKHASNPMIVADQPWEGRSAIIGPYVYGTVMKEEGRFRLWYQLLNQGNHVGYAESADGIHWTKPELDIVSHEGKKTNLVVSAFAPDLFDGVQCHNPSVISCPLSPHPDRRYALYGLDSASGGPRVAFSRDGIHWKYWDSGTSTGKPLPLFTSGDVVSFFDDPYRQQIAATWKTRNRRGRAVGVAFAADGLNWSKVYDGPVFVADDLDPDDTQIYGMPAFAYQGMYIGLPWIYRARYFRYGEYTVDKLHEAQNDSPRTMEVQLSWSWDLVNWTRPPQRAQFLPRGDDSAWDSGMTLVARAPVQVGDELWFYYTGTSKVHDDPRVPAAIGLAKLRLDGFCSYSCRGNASPDSRVGWLISRREPMRQPRVAINAITGPRGSISVEILDRTDRVVPGFSRDLCVPFRGDSTHHEIAWNSSQSIQPLTQPDCKLRFWLEDAELFSYHPMDLDPQQFDLAR
ncbi:MAG: hypothetical protein KDB03_11215 [Planctomycetales bacterium]|nr:hypothetical protein [Planctomycetales bacterium]